VLLRATGQPRLPLHVLRSEIPRLAGEGARLRTDSALFILRADRVRIGKNGCRACGRSPPSRKERGKGGATRHRLFLSDHFSLLTTQRSLLTILGIGATLVACIREVRTVAMEPREKDASTLTRSRLRPFAGWPTV